MKETPNLSYFIELACGDKEFGQQFLKLLKEEFSWEVGMYLRHIKKNEPRAAVKMVSRSKFKLSMLGLANSFDFANSHEENLYAGDISMHNDYVKILNKVSVFLYKNDLIPPSKA